jgi:hypothetical protein
LNFYTCTIFNHNYTFEEHEAWLGPEHVPAVRVASIIVRARSRREAAARAYVRTVGRVRARILRDLNAPAILVRFETRWRVLARGLGRVRNWLGDCFTYDNMVEAFFVRVQRRPDIQGLAGREALRRRRRLLRALAIAAPN